MITGSSDRRPDIDWLRVLATLLVVAFHTAMVFNPAPFYHIRNSDLSFLMVVFCGFVSLWHMPLFFVLAGWSLARAIGSRCAWGILQERAARLGVPLLTGTILLMPWIKFLELRSGLNLNYRGLWVTEPLQAGFRTVIPSGLPTMAEFHEPLGTFPAAVLHEPRALQLGPSWSPSSARGSAGCRSPDPRCATCRRPRCRSTCSTRAPS